MRTSIFFTVQIEKSHFIKTSQLCKFSSHWKTTIQKIVYEWNFQKYCGNHTFFDCNILHCKITYNIFIFFPLIGSIPTNKKCWSTRKFCNFCRQNGHMSEYYEGHRLRDGSGRLECPILRAHVCDVCGATGDEAHTLSYCPVLKAAGVAPPKTALLLKNTLYDSCGRRRRPY